MDSAHHAESTPELTHPEESASLLHAWTIRFWRETEVARHAQNIKEPTNPKDSAPRAHAVTQNTMTRRVTALTAHHAQDPRHQDLSASLILVMQLKSLPEVVNAQPAQHTKSQPALLILKDNVVENAKRLLAQQTQSSFRTVAANHAPPGPDHKRETESVDQMSAVKEKNYREMVAAPNATSILEEMETKNKDCTLNAFQTNANPIKF